MTTPDWVERFYGAYATPQLVGRTQLRAQIQEIVQSRSQEPYVIFLTGGGGIGKTRLLKAALQDARELEGVRAAKDLIDLYHVPTHSAYGLADAMYLALTPPYEPFRHYGDQRRALERMRLAGEVAGLADQRERVLEAFSTELQVLAQKQRIVLALDTAERLVYETGQMSAVIAQFAEAWTWLVDSLSKWNNIVILAAGRPGASPLYEKLKETLGDQAKSIPVGPFTKEESLAYFDAVALDARSNNRHEIAKRVDELTSEIRSLAHVYADGRPILLALLIDYLSVSGWGQLPVALLAPVPTADSEAKRPDTSAVQTALEEELIGRLKEAAGCGDTILALGRAPKGADAELLSKLLDIPIREAHDRLNEASQFSFVKVRKADDRVFLHDEMYALLQRWVYDAPADAPQADKAARAILDYYTGQIDRSRQELNELYKPVEIEGKDRLNWPRLAEVHTLRQTLLAEIVFYRLRQDAVRGFQRYYRYAREAALSGDTTLDVQLQTEMLAFLTECNSQSEQKTINGLDRNLALWVIALRPVVRAYANQRYPKMLKDAAHLRAHSTALIQAGAPMAEAVLSTWEATALIHIGGEDNFQSAREKLDAAINSVEALAPERRNISDRSEAKAWRALAVLAFAYRVRAYLQWERGFSQGAIEDYRKAAGYWRQINLQIELATTLNDMGFATAELGYFADARALINDALDLRRQLGPRSPVGLSLNTLALIELREGAYVSAIRRVESALALFRALQDQRGAGLALIAMSDAQRRYSGTSLIPDPDEKVDILREARDHAREALRIFEQIDETFRQVEALINEGTACRDWVKIRREHPSSRDDVMRLKEDSAEALMRAARLAGEAMLDHKVNALVNLAFLGFFAGEDDLLISAAQEAEAAIPPEYRISKLTGQPFISYDQAKVLLWPQLGKLHILYGHREFLRYTQAVGVGAQAQKALLMAAEWYVWSLQYNVLYGQESLGVRGARDEIYERLKGVDFNGLKAIAGKVSEIEEEYHLGKSALRQLLQHRALWYM